jgi:hypothetical protein
MRRFILCLIAVVFISLPLAQAASGICHDGTCRVNAAERTAAETPDEGSQKSQQAGTVSQHSCCVSAFDKSDMSWAVFIPAQAGEVQSLEVRLLPSLPVGPLFEPPAHS